MESRRQDMGEKDDDCEIATFKIQSLTIQIHFSHQNG